MKIAVTYDNGNVFQHFGKTSKFKLYDVEDGKVVATTIVNSQGAGHSALAGLLNSYEIDVLLCGGMGDGAQNALSELGIEVVSGIDGDTDAAVQEYINGNLISAGVNCDHHHEEQSEDDDCGCGCGGGCGNCGGGCGGGCGHHAEPEFEGPNVGLLCKVHYEGTFNDGTVFDSSYERNEPLEFVCGTGMMISGFDKAVATMSVGEIVNVHLMPSEAYGMRDPSAIFSLRIQQLPGSENLSVGESIYLSNGNGQPFPVTVLAKDEENITFDANHEMAGKELNFKIELVEVK
ncbi:MAG: FKBP-type peptidyl-prolyl cis-trans isomerase [Clostridia bacterium]|nr:FKBP-type peptidyl-prolyl cis-trans isomerase [Clostridia bacterium]